MANKLASQIKNQGKTNIAVIDFNDLQGGTGGELGKYIAEELTVDLVMDRKGFSVLDRAHLKKILAEHNLSQDIDRETFLAQKETLLAKKKQLQESVKKNENGQMPWIEPFTEWIKTAKTVGEITSNGSPQEKKIVASKVFGSNLFLDSKKARGSCVKPWSLLVQNSSTGGVVPEEGIEPPTKGL
jgi:hypothetical protein